MSRILYYLVLKPISYLPLSVLYGISNILHFILYKVTGYRRKVVYNNIKNSFPEKSHLEILEIERQFYVHLCDMLAESIKMFSISANEVQRRFKIINTDLLQEYYDQNKSIILVGGHYNNWEMASVAFKFYSPHKPIGIYSPLSNKFFDQKIRDSRGKYGLMMVAKKAVKDTFEQFASEPTITVFGGDQSPTYSKRVCWTHFLNQETAVFTGSEFYAHSYDYPVLFIRIDKVKRGHYEATLHKVHDKPLETEPGEITRLHTQMLEDIIKEIPQFWLWSHKRWKRKITEEEKMQLQKAA